MERSLSTLQHGLHAPPGTLRRHPDEDRVQCHSCGGWFRALAPGHLRRHEITADEYRVFVGLRPRHPLGVPSLSKLRAVQLRERISQDRRVQEGMRVGVALARSGRLQAEARAVAAQRGSCLERQQELVASGRRVGAGRAVAFRERRERRARELGFEDLEDYLRQRYVAQRIRIEDLAAELGVAVSAVRGDLGRFGIDVRRGAPRRRRAKADISNGT